MNYEKLGAEIRRYRKLKRLTLEQLAERLDVSTTFIGQIERATGKPSLETLVKIANALEVSADALLFGDLSKSAGHSHFLKKVEELTAQFSPKEKELLIKNIEIIRAIRDEGK